MPTHLRPLVSLSLYLATYMSQFNAYSSSCLDKHYDRSYPSNTTFALELCPFNIFYYTKN